MGPLHPPLCRCRAMFSVYRNVSLILRPTSVLIFSHIDLRGQRVPPSTLSNHDPVSHQRSLPSRGLHLPSAPDSLIFPHVPLPPHLDRMFCRDFQKLRSQVYSAAVGEGNSATQLRSGLHYLLFLPIYILLCFTCVSPWHLRNSARRDPILRLPCALTPVCAEDPLISSPHGRLLLDASRTLWLAGVPCPHHTSYPR